MYYVKSPIELQRKAFIAIALSIATLGFAGLHGAVAQSTPTETPTPGGPAPFVTNNYTEAVNVRSGPNSLYSFLGSLPIGATAQALAVSPQHEWIQIAFPSAPDGVGWVYAPFVDLSPGYLRVVEPPPTPTALPTVTNYPTLEAQFQMEPTVTRLPTFTPPPPLAVPTFAAQARSADGFPTGITIVAVAVAGGLVLAVSLLWHR